MKKHNYSGIMPWIKGLMFKRIHGMLSCREFEDFVLDYFDNTLSERQQKQFKLHLRLCRECRQYIEAYHRSIEASQAVFQSPDEPLPKDVPEDLIKTILNLRND